MPRKKEFGFIINPNSGHGFGRTYAQTVEKMIKIHGIDAEIRYTLGTGHATEIAAEYAKKGLKNIILVGGDGTYNEAIQSLVNKKDITIGTIPTGTGNDFIPVLGFSERFTDDDWRIFFEMNTISLDAGKCNEKYFINGMGVGFDAQVAWENHKIHDTKKSPFSFLKYNYTWHILKNLFFYKAKKMRFKTGDKWRDGHCFLTTIGNGRRLGAGYFLTPKAVANDGFFDICLIQEIPIPIRLKEMLAVKKGMHIYDKVVEYFQAKEICLEFEEEVPSHIDGEMIYFSRFDVKIIPSALKFIYNPYGPAYLKIK